MQWFERSLREKELNKLSDEDKSLAKSFMARLGQRILEQTRFRNKKAFKIKYYWLGANDLEIEGNMTWSKTKTENITKAFTDYSQSISWNVKEDRDERIAGLSDKIQIAF